MRARHEDTQPAAELVGASRSFRTIEAVTDVDIQVRPGEVVALLGPNGAGKTTGRFATAPRKRSRS